MEIVNKPNWNRKVRTQVTESALFKGLIMADHFDAEITCEEVYRDEDRVTGEEMILHLAGTLPEREDYCEDFATWDELLAAEEIFDAVVKTDLTSENSVVQ